MSADEKADWSLIDFARQVAGIPANLRPADDQSVSPPVVDAKQASSNVSSDLDNNADTAPVAQRQANVPPIEVPVIFPANKQLKTANEIAEIILNTLQDIDGCPTSGFTVTVYGSNPWNAMLTVRPGTGRAIDFPHWAARVREIGVKFRETLNIIS